MEDVEMCERVRGHEQAMISLVINLLINYT